MCLISNEEKPKIAEHDIKAYKCFRSVRETYSSKHYRDLYTLFLHRPVTHDEATGKVPLVGKVEKDVMVPVSSKDPKAPKQFKDKWTVDAGYIHAFTSREAAVEVMRKNFIGREWYFPVVVEVTIPEGTPYFEGVDTKGYPCFAADKVVVGKYLDCFIDNKLRDYTESVAAIEKEKPGKQEKEEFE